MAGLSQQTLTRLRTQATAELEMSGWRCVIVSQGSTENDLGETIPGTPTDSAELPCKLVSTASVASREQLEPSTGGVQQITSWQIVLPWNAPDMTSADMIRITQPTPERVFEVMQTTGPHTHEVRRIIWVEERS